MERDIVQKLVAWKENQEKKPLILKGLRQCGKTYILQDFGNKHYEDTAYFNFEGNEKIADCFQRDLDPKRIMAELSILRQKTIEPGSTLVIFDEIQFCNRALTSLKYFCEENSGFHIACAGSLLGIALSKPFSFPVGKVDFLTLRPLSLREFLIASGEKMLLDYIENFAGARIPEAFAERLETYLKTYYIVGGMPEVVSSWITEQNIGRVEEIQQRILESYELDFAKHAPVNDFPRLQAVWRSIPLQLAKENSKFIFSQVKQGARAKDFEDALEWLVGAGLAFKVSKIEKPFMPLAAYADDAFFKVYMADCGLLRKMSRLPPGAILEKNSVYREFKGALTENYVLTELVNRYGDVPYFWRSSNTAEVDFVFQDGVNIIPLEVKSERNDRSKSLNEYRKKYEPAVAVKTTMKNSLEMENGVFDLPLYLVGALSPKLGDVLVMDLKKEPVETT
jgi:predicted AAA+ superfamily ATPase